VKPSRFRSTGTTWAPKPSPASAAPGTPAEFWLKLAGLAASTPPVAPYTTDTYPAPALTLIVPPGAPTARSAWPSPLKSTNGAVWTDAWATLPGRTTALTAATAAASVTERARRCRVPGLSPGLGMGLDM